MVTNLPKDFLNEGHQPYPGWSPTIPRRVTHHPKFGCQLDLEIDSSASQLVNLVASKAQLVSSSGALPAIELFAPELAEPAK